MGLLSNLFSIYFEIRYLKLRIQLNWGTISGEMIELASVQIENKNIMLLGYTLNRGTTVGANPLTMYSRVLYSYTRNIIIYGK